MPALFPAVEGDEGGELTKDFLGNSLSQYCDELLAIAEKDGIKPISEFEYYDEDLLEDCGVELDDEQTEWYSTADGITAIEHLSQHPSLPDDADLKAELNLLSTILKNVPPESKGWHLEHDI